MINKSRRPFWSYVKQQFNQRTSSPPSFDSTTCTLLFCTLFRSINPAKSLKISSWILSLPQPTISCDLSPPSYHQVTKIVRRMKASGLPCPLDKISLFHSSTVPIFVRISQLYNCVFAASCFIASIFFYFPYIVACQ